MSTIAGLRTPASDSGSDLQILPTSPIHTNQLSNIIPVLLQHKSTSQFRYKSLHLNTDPLYMFPPAIHSTNRITNKIVPLASKPITQLPDNLSYHRDITPQPDRAALRRPIRELHGAHHGYGCHVRHTHTHNSPWQPRCQSVTSYNKLGVI